MSSTCSLASFRKTCKSTWISFTALHSAPSKSPTTVESVWKFSFFEFPMLTPGMLTKMQRDFQASFIYKIFPCDLLTCNIGYNHQGPLTFSLSRYIIIFRFRGNQWVQCTRASKVTFAVYPPAKSIFKCFVFTERYLIIVYCQTNKYHWLPEWVCKPISGKSMSRDKRMTAALPCMFSGIIHKH